MTLFLRWIVPTDPCDADPAAPIVAVIGSRGEKGEKGDTGDSVAVDPGDLTLIFDNHLI